MAKSGPSYLRAAPGLLDARERHGVSAGFVDELAADRDSRVPLRHFLEKSSDFSFVQIVSSSLSAWALAEGLPAELGPELAELVIAAPSIAMSRMSTEVDRLVRQAVVLGRSEGVPLDILVRLDSRISAQPNIYASGRRTPPAVARTEVSTSFIDLEDRSGPVTLVSQLVGWRKEFTHPKDTVAGGSAVVLGDPSGLGVTGTPPEWRTRVTEVIEAFGFDAHLFASRFSGTVPRNTRAIFRLDPYSGADPQAPLGLVVTDVDARGLTFDAVLDVIIAQLVLASDPSDPAVDPTFRALKPGERVFHRKQGSGRSFDRFDAGSSAPCSHGVASFVRFSGDKSTKGFRRRYSNFADDMLYHCRKYPNCGMYAVFAPLA